MPLRGALSGLGLKRTLADGESRARMSIRRSGDASAKIFRHETSLRVLFDDEFLGVSIKHKPLIKASLGRFGVISCAKCKSQVRPRR